MKKKTNTIGLLLFLLLALPGRRLFAQLPEGAKGSTFTGTPLPYSDYFTVRDGMKAFYTTATKKKKATVAFLGGSITFNPGWRDKVCAWLQERFPGTRFRFIAAGIPSLGSLPHAFRVQRDVLDSGRIDLLFLEAAVNDRVNGTDSVTQVRSLEGIVRHAKRENPSLNIILMAFADPGKTADYDRGVIPAEIANQELVARYYGLPSINIGKEVHDKIRHGELDWKLDFKDIHPAPFGQELYFENIRQLMDTSEYAATRAARRQLPPPLDSAALEYGRYEDVRHARYDTAWRRYPDWTPADKASTRPGFVNVPMLVAGTPGARLSLSFEGTAVGMAVISGPDAGIIEYSLDEGPIKKMDLYTQWSSWLHLPWYVLFGNALSEGPHILTLRISSEKNPNSTGTACRIVHFLVNR